VVVGVEQPPAVADEHPQLLELLGARAGAVGGLSFEVPDLAPGEPDEHLVDVAQRCVHGTRIGTGHHVERHEPKARGRTLAAGVVDPALDHHEAAWKAS
jgi:hypothetical protein